MKDHLQDYLRTGDDDYLWDRSGNPDPEIQKLENVLGTLRYQPRPLVIPDHVGITRHSFRRFGPRLAIAATILLAIGAGALWLNMRPREQTQLADTKQAPANDSVNAAVTVPVDVLQEIAEEAPGQVPVEATGDQDTATDGNRQSTGSKPIVRRKRSGQTGSTDQRRVAEPGAHLLAANELREAEASKERLMLALRFASTKLNLALKKANGTNNRNLIHNQHRIG